MTEEEFRKKAVDMTRQFTDAWVRCGPLGHRMTLRHQRGEAILHITPRRVVVPGPPLGEYNQIVWTAEVDGLGYAYRVMDPPLALELMRLQLPIDAQLVRDTMAEVAT